MMRIEECIGKHLDINEAINRGFSYCDNSEDEYENSTLEKFLYEYQCDGFTDHSGFNFYSILIHLDGEKILDIERIGHCHMCGGQGADDELDEFPHETLEEEAEVEILSILKN
jgi:hypothetical protein